MPSNFRSLRAALFAGVVSVLVLPAHASSVQTVCSGSAISQLGFPAFASDPATTNGSGFPRCITGPGTVSSGISQNEAGRLLWDTRSTISVDPALGIQFSGFAEVTFNNMPANINIGDAAGTVGYFLDDVTITAPPALASGSGTFEIPLHITGSASALGTVVGPGIPHSAELVYDFLSLGTVTFGEATDTIGIDTTGETVTCDAAACGISPVLFDKTVMVRLPFTFGEEFTLKGVFSVGASFFLDSPTEGFLSGLTIADFAHTVTLGPARVLDANGDLVVGATIASDIDYFAGTTTAAVPEPSSLALLTAGIGFGLAVVRRRSSNRSRNA